MSGIALKERETRPLELGATRATVELLRLALPLIAVTASRMAMGFIDLVMVAALGTDAVAALSPASLLVWAFMSLGLGLVTSVQTFAAQADGRGQPEQGAAYAWQGVYVGLVCAVLLAPVTWLVPGLYGWIGAVGQHAPAVQFLETEYTRITLWSILPAMIAATFESFFNGVQRPRITLIAVLVSLGTNAFGNWLLIWGKFGLPRMEIAGAAIATVIGWWARAAVVFIAFIATGTNARYHTRRAWRPAWAYIRGILRIGGPISVAWLADVGSWFVFLNFIIPPFGTAPLAATNIAIQYTHLAFMPAIGVGMALCSQVGFAIGAGRPDEARRRTRTGLWVNMGYMGAIGVALFLLRRPLLHLMSADDAVITAGMLVMCWVALYQIFDAMSITFIFALRGAGDTRVPAVLNAGCCWLIFVLGGWAAAHWRPDWGVDGPWVLAVTYLVVLGLALLWRYSRQSAKFAFIPELAGGARPESGSE